MCMIMPILYFLLVIVASMFCCALFAAVIAHGLDMTQEGCACDLAAMSIMFAGPNASAFEVLFVIVKLLGMNAYVNNLHYDFIYAQFF